MLSAKSGKICGPGLCLHFAWYNFCRIHEACASRPQWRQESHTKCGQFLTYWRRIGGESNSKSFNQAATVLEYCEYSGLALDSALLDCNMNFAQRPWKCLRSLSAASVLCTLSS